MPFEVRSSPQALSATSQSEASSPSSSDDDGDSDDASAQGLKQKPARIHTTVADTEEPEDNVSPSMETWLEDQSMPVSRKPTSEMPQRLDSMQFAITCLYKIPIRRPATLGRSKKISSIDLTHFEPFDALYIDHRVPSYE